MKKNYRIKSKKRFSAFVFALVLMITAATGLVAGSESADAMTDSAYAEVLVQNGDTLWDLAQSYGPSDQDTRVTVHTICEINKTSPEDLQPGQTIMIPRS